MSRYRILRVSDCSDKSPRSLIKGACATLHGLYQLNRLRKCIHVLIRVKM